MGIMIKIVKDVPAGIVLLILLFILTAPSAKATDNEKRLTLAEAVSAAMENNHELKAQASALAAKREDIGLARSSLLPKVSFEERYLKTVNPGYAFMTKLNQERIEAADFVPASLNHPEAISDFQSAISFEQPLFIRKANIGLAMSKTDAEASAEDLQRKKEEIAFKVVQCYLLVGTAAEYIGVAEKAREDAREHQRLAEVRYQAGLGLYSDVLRAATAAAEAEQKLVSAGKNLRMAKRTLGLMLGSEAAVDIAETPPTLPVRNREYLQTQSLARRDVKSMELRKENARNNIKLAEAGYFPFLGLGGSYQLNDHNRPLGSEGDSWQLMAFLKWELFDGTKREHEKSKAQYQATAADEYLAGLKKMVSFQLEEAWLTMEEAKKNVDFAKEALKTAEEGRRLVKVRYEGALSPIVDMLDTQV
ncbi:MAG: TolC family protein, partial [Syntrophales bacterium LBB04]|nr:TolC family protein [Syntrophales bacterium LBB04]